MNRRTLILGASALGVAAFAGGAFVLKQRRDAEAEAAAAATPTEDQALLVRDYSPSFGPADAPVILLGAFAGLRVAEIAALRVADVDFMNDRFWVQIDQIFGMARKIAALTYLHEEMFLTAGLIYRLIAFVLMQGFKLLERWLRVDACQGR